MIKQFLGSFMYNIVIYTYDLGGDGVSTDPSRPYRVVVQYWRSRHGRACPGGLNRQGPAHTRAVIPVHLISTYIGRNA